MFTVMDNQQESGSSFSYWKETNRNQRLHGAVGEILQIHTFENDEQKCEV